MNPHSMYGIVSVYRSKMDADELYFSVLPAHQKLDYDTALVRATELTEEKGTPHAVMGIVAYATPVAGVRIIEVDYEDADQYYEDEDDDDGVPGEDDEDEEEAQNAVTAI